MEGRVEPGFEIRRILLLTRLGEAAKGLTMSQMVGYCSRVSGWALSSEALSEVVRHVLQTLIDDKLVTARTRFVLTERGRDYLEDPLKWRMAVETREDAEQNMFWKSIYEVFDKAYARLRSRAQAGFR